MSYQNVGKPRFYIDYLTYWQSIGLIKEIKTTTNMNLTGTPVGLDPVSPFIFSGTPNANSTFTIAIDFNENINFRTLESLNFISYLGHTFGKFYGGATSSTIRLDLYKRNSENANMGDHTHRGVISQANVDIENQEILNGTFFTGADALSVESGNYTLIDKSGCTIIGVNANTDNTENLKDIDRIMIHFKQFEAGTEENSNDLIEDYSNANAFWNMNCMAIGHYYDMPNTPDLDVKINIEFDGYDSVETIGGATLTNVRYEGNPKWANNNAWEVGNSESQIKRNGRRSWDMKFSFLSDKDIFSSNYSSNSYIQDGADTLNDDYNDNEDLTADRSNFEYTLADDDSFVAKVLNYVGNGQRFIFQPDVNNNNPDQFAICVLDQDSLSINQKAFKSYEISLKIKEVW